MIRRVIIESPWAGDVERHARYLRACLRDSLLRGEAPFASHGLYVGPLDDDVPAERALGIAAGVEWMTCADAVVVYDDLGISPGMAAGILAAEAEGVPVERRTIGGAW